MNQILALMLNKYPEATTPVAAKNAIKQIVQEITLCGLARSNFYQCAAFNGGTALRIFHGLPRFSEDLDFSVDSDKAEIFDLSNYSACMNNELDSLKIPARFEIDAHSGTVERGYVKGNCREILGSFGLGEKLLDSVAANEVLSIKIEADKTKLHGAGFETKYLVQPYPAPIRIYDGPSLFAGKVDAVIARNWKNRVKGRDLYDYLFYISNRYKLNLEHLKSRLQNHGLLDDHTASEFGNDALKNMLISRFESIDFNSAKMDVLPFITDTSSIDFWSSEMFIAVTKEYDF